MCVVNFHLLFKFETAASKTASAWLIIRCSSQTACVQDSHLTTINQSQKLRDATLKTKQWIGAVHILCQPISGGFRPPLPLVSLRQHLADPPSSNECKEKTLFDIILQRPFGCLWWKSIHETILAAFVSFTHIFGTLNPISLNFSPTLPPSSAIVSICPTPSPPSGGWRNMWTAPYRLWRLFLYYNRNVFCLR